MLTIEMVEKRRQTKAARIFEVFFIFLFFILLSWSLPDRSED